MTDYPVPTSQTSSNILLGAGDTMEIFNGGTATSTTIAGGDQLIAAGGAAISTTINGGHQRDYGTAISTTVNGGEQDLYSGGTATSTTVISGGIEYIFGGSSDAAATVSSGGLEYVYGTASSTTIDGGFQFVEAGGAATNTTVNGGEQDVYNGATATSTTVNGGVQHVFWGGTVTSVTVSGGVQVVDATAVAAHTDISGGEQDVYNGAMATRTTLIRGVQHVFSGGSVTSVTVRGGVQVVDGSAAATNTDVNGGEQDVYGTATSTTVTGGVQHILSGGTAVKTLVAGGVQVVDAGATTIDTILNGGSLDLAAGAITIGTITFSGNELLKLDQAVSGTVEFTSPLANVVAGDAIDLTGLSFDGSNPPTATVSGSLLTVTNGDATEVFTLADPSVSAFTVSQDSGSGILLTATAAATVGFTPGVTFANAHTATLTGTVSDPSSSTVNVEIFNGDPADGGQDLGPAELNGDGTWSFTANFGRGDFNALTAVATDDLGQTATSSAPYELVTGITGEPYRAQEFDYGSDGSYGYIDYSKNGTGLVYALDNGDGTHTTWATANNQILQSIGNDTMSGGGVGQRFVFTPGFGQDEITDFYATSPQHDTIDLSQTRFHTLAQVLQHTTMGDGGAVIHLNPQNSITIDGVSKAELKAHPKDLTFG